MRSKPTDTAGRPIGFAPIGTRTPDTTLVDALAAPRESHDYLRGYAVGMLAASLDSGMPDALRAPAIPHDARRNVEDLGRLFGYDVRFERPVGEGEHQLFTAALTINDQGRAVRANARMRHLSEQDVPAWAAQLPTADAEALWREALRLDEKFYGGRARKRLETGAARLGRAQAAALFFFFTSRSTRDHVPRAFVRAMRGAR